MTCEIVQLNIGGTSYTTTKQTLHREPESLLPKLFEPNGLERYSDVIGVLPDGTYFVDRDGELFAYILDYLRTGKLLLPDNFKDTARLREEVLFYQLEDLNHLLTPYYNLKYHGKKSMVNGTTPNVETNGSFSGETGRLYENQKCYNLALNIDAVDKFVRSSLPSLRFHGL